VVLREYEPKWLKLSEERAACVYTSQGKADEKPEDDAVAKLYRGIVWRLDTPESLLQEHEAKRARIEEVSEIEGQLTEEELAALHEKQGNDRQILNSAAQFALKYDVLVSNAKRVEDVKEHAAALISRFGLNSSYTPEEIHKLMWVAVENAQKVTNDLADLVEYKKLDRYKGYQRSPPFDASTARTQMKHRPAPCVKVTGCAAPATASGGTG